MVSRIPYQQVACKWKVKSNKVVCRNSSYVLFISRISIHLQPAQHCHFRNTNIPPSSGRCLVYILDLYIHYVLSDYPQPRKNVSFIWSFHWYSCILPTTISIITVVYFFSWKLFQGGSQLCSMLLFSFLDKSIFDGNWGTMHVKKNVCLTKLSLPSN